jgi:hypothetical protein
MDEISRASSESPTLDAGAWIGRVVIAVLVAEAIWGFIVSVTNGLILPLLARTMGGDVQSPLYLGKGEFNVPGLFMAVLELCFAGLAAVIMNSFLQRKPRMMRSKPVTVSPIPAQPVMPARPAVQPDSPAPIAAVPATISAPPYTAPTVATRVRVSSGLAPTQATVTSVPPQPGQFSSPPEPSPQPKPAAPPLPATPKAKPAKPKAPKEVYYNIVGEPINPTEDD